MIRIMADWKGREIGFMHFVSSARCLACGVVMLVFYWGSPKRITVVKPEDERDLELSVLRENVCT